MRVRRTGKSKAAIPMSGGGTISKATVGKGRAKSATRKSERGETDPDGVRLGSLLDVGVAQHVILGTVMGVVDTDSETF